MPNTNIGVGKGQIGGVYRDGYTPHCLILDTRPEVRVALFAYEIRLAVRNGVAPRKLLRRYAYYARNGGLSLEQRRKAFEIGTMTTQTEQLIRQAAHELQLENLRVEASVEQPGFYVVRFVNWEPTVGAEGGLADVTATIPMDAEFKSIIAILKATPRSVAENP